MSGENQVNETYDPKRIYDDYRILGTPSREEPPEGVASGQDEEPRRGSMVKKVLVGAGVIIALLFKFKGLAIAVLKFFPLLLKTGGTMLISIGVYALAYGWMFAVGLVLLLFVHECGHLVAARRIGLKVGVPVFIPFMGAFIALKEAPKDAWIEAQVGIGGPLIGSLGAFACLFLYIYTREPFYLALAYVGFILNLFNLIPMGMLDGGRVVAAISPALWLVGAIISLGLLFCTFNIILLLIFVLCLPKVFMLFREKTEEERRYYTVSFFRRAIISFLYFGLAGVLAIATMISHESLLALSSKSGKEKPDAMVLKTPSGMAY